MLGWSRALAVNFRSSRFCIYTEDKNGQNFSDGFYVQCEKNC